MRSPPIHFLVVLALVIPSPSGAQTPYRRAVELERSGQLEEAEQILLAARDSLAPADTLHLNALRAFRALLPIVEAYRGEGDFASARAVFDSVDLHSVRDYPLVSQRRVLLEAIASQDGYARIDRGVGLLDARRNDAAGVLFGLVAQDTTYPDMVRDSATRAKAVADRALARADSGVWATFKQGAMGAFRGLSTQLLYVAVVAGLLWLLFLVPTVVKPKPEARLVMEDLTVSDEDRARANRALTLEVRRAINSATDETRPLRADATSDLDGGEAASIQSNFSLPEQVFSMLSDSEPVKLGVISFRPTDLWRLLTAVFSRPYAKELSGALASAGDDFRFFMERFDRNDRKTTVTSGQWVSGSPGTREAVISEVATRYVFDNAKWKPSSDWRSFEAHGEANQALDQVARATEPEKKQVHLKNARDHLVKAIEYDPMNFLARYRLGEVHRRLGGNETARDSFKRVRRLVDLPAHEQPDALKKFIEKNPEFPSLVRYNLALTLSKFLSLKERRDALGILQSLQTSVAPDPSKGERSPGSGAGSERLDLLFMSAEASLRAGLMELLIEEGKENDPPEVAEPRTPADGAAWDARLREFIANFSVKGLFTSGVAATPGMEKGDQPRGAEEPPPEAGVEVETSGEAGDDDDPTPATQDDIDGARGHKVPSEFQQHAERIAAILERIRSSGHSSARVTLARETALAVTLNAAARAKHHVGRYDEAIELYDESIATVAVMGDPYLGRASAYLKERPRRPDWVQRADADLERAEKLSPENPKVKHYQGKVALVRRNWDVAIEAFRKAEELDGKFPHPWTLYLHAVALLHSGAGFPAALGKLDESMERKARPDLRCVCYVRWALRHAAEAGSEEYLQRASGLVRALESLPNSGSERDLRLKKLGKRLRERFRKATRRQPEPQDATVAG